MMIHKFERAANGVFIPLTAEENGEYQRICELREGARKILPRCSALCRKIEVAVEKIQTGPQKKIGDLFELKKMKNMESVRKLPGLTVAESDEFRQLIVAISAVADLEKRFQQLRAKYLAAGGGDNGAA